MKIVNSNDPKFVMTLNDVEGGIAIHPYGAIISPKDTASITVTVEYEGETYTGTITSSTKVGDTVTLNKTE